MEYTKSEIKKIIKDEDIKFIRLQFADIFGVLKSVSITPSQLDKALDDKIMFDGSSVDGFVRIEESDMRLVPDIKTFLIHPWDQEKGKVARIICDVYRGDEPFEGDPRYILKKAVKRAKDKGFTFNVGPECEFYLFETDEKNRPIVDTVYDQGEYFEVGAYDVGEDARKDIVLALEKMGFEIEASHHECGPSQHEIDFKYDEAIKSADNIITFKYAVKKMAAKHNLYASFLPKPLYGEAGNGMHLNMSLMKNGKNAFVDERNSRGLSKTAYSFMGGIMKHVDAMTLITNPLVNSYKRFVPDFEAPIYIAWSSQNRSPLIRVPSSRGQSTRIELRNPDPSANPYLALAACLEAGLDGIENKLTPPAPVDKNIFEMSKREITRSGIKSLPSNMFEAIQKIEKDKFILEVLGSHISEKYISAKKREWADYSYQVSDWEMKRYLLKY